MEIPRPRKGDRLFKPGGSWNLFAWTIADMSVAACGYKEAADTLVARLASGSRNDGLVAPIVYCYRQYLELRLKMITESASWITGKKFKHDHNLLNLWQPLEQQLTQELQERDREALEAVDACIREMHEIDPSGTAFRYPEFVSLNQKAHQLDLGNLKEVMGRVAVFLDGTQDAWSDW